MVHKQCPPAIVLWSSDLGLPARPNSLAGAGTSDQEAPCLGVGTAVAAAAAAGKVPEVDTSVTGV